MRGNQEDIDANLKLGAVVMVGGVVVMGCAAVGMPLIPATAITTGAMFLLKKMFS